MSIVVDFVRFVLRRPERSRPLVLGQSAPGLNASARPAMFDEDALRNALAQLDGAQASDVINFRAGPAAACLSYGVDRRHVANVAMQAFQDAAWILSFDGDGYIRAAALKRLRSPARSVGRFVSIALRLNDWAPEVRAEAVDAARRVWSQTTPEIIAEATPYLLEQRFGWKRWAEEALCVDDVLGRSDVVVALTALLSKGRSGPLGRTLSQALRFSSYDLGLPNLATKACLPDVRAIAMKTLLSGKAVWPIGYGWVWTDKSLGKRRRVRLTESRTISISAPSDLLEIGLADRSALVRKIAADAVIERMHDLPDAVEIAHRLANDKSAAVRDRADYIKRHLTGDAMNK